MAPKGTAWPACVNSVKRLQLSSENIKRHIINLSNYRRVSKCNIYKWYYRNTQITVFISAEDQALWSTLSSILLSKLCAVGRTEEQHKVLPQAGSSWGPGLSRVLSSTLCYWRRDPCLYEQPLIYFTHYIVVAIKRRWGHCLHTLQLALMNLMTVRWIPEVSGCLWMHLSRDPHRVCHRLLIVNLLLRNLSDSANKDWQQQ